VASLAIPVRGARAQDDTAPSKPTSDTAKELYAQRRYVEAARAFEAMDTPGAIYNAAMARTAAGHHAHALLHWTRYLELGPAEERADVQERIEEIRERTAEVHFVRSEDSTRPATLVLHADPNSAADALRVSWPVDRPELVVFLDNGRWATLLESDAGQRKSTVTVTKRGTSQRFDLSPPHRPTPVRLELGPPRALRRGVAVAWTGPRKAAVHRVVNSQTSAWELAPGTWQVQASADGYNPLEHTVAVTERPTKVPLRLTRARDRTRLRLGLSLGAAGVGLATSGGVLLGLGNKDQRDLGGLDGENDASGDEVAQTLDRMSRRHAPGVALLAAGGASFVVALTAGLSRSRRSLAAEAGLGAALAVAGTVLHVAWGQQCSHRQQDKSEYGKTGWEPAPRDLKICATERTPGMLLTGAGIGLFGAAVAALITHRASGRRQRRMETSASISPNSMHIGIRGTF